MQRVHRSEQHAARLPETHRRRLEPALDALGEGGGRLGGEAERRLGRPERAELPAEGIDIDGGGGDIPRGGRDDAAGCEERPVEAPRPLAGGRRARVEQRCELGERGPEPAARAPAPRPRAVETRGDAPEGVGAGPEALPAAEPHDVADVAPAEAPAAEIHEVAPEQRREVAQPPAVDAEPEQAPREDAEGAAGERLPRGGIEREVVLGEDLAGEREVRAEPPEGDGAVRRPERALARQQVLDLARDAAELILAVGREAAADLGPAGAARRLLDERAGEAGAELPECVLGAGPGPGIESQDDL